MPRFISKDGVWHPADKKTKKALEGVGLETVGAPAKGSGQAIEAPVEGEDLEETMSKKEKKMLKKVKKRRGIKSRKIRRKIL